MNKSGMNSMVMKRVMQTAVVGMANREDVIAEIDVCIGTAYVIAMILKIALNVIRKPINNYIKRRDES